VRCLGVKALLKIFSDRNPGASVLNLLAPRAHSQEALEIEEARDDSPGEKHDWYRDEKDNERLKAGFSEIGLVRPAKQKGRYPKEFVGPRHRNYRTERGDLKP
jgi:hypothetical protein